MTGYSSLPAGTYYIDLKDANPDTILTTYAVDFSGFQDSTAVLFTSGFSDPSANQGGAMMGLFGAFSDGTVIEFPAVSIAFLQPIHNCADPLADSLDIYALGALAVDNFKFRTATNYLAVPAGIPIDVGVALGNSTSIADTIRNFPVIFENGKNYIAMASGVTNPGNFEPNPDGKDISFNLQLIDYAKLKSATPPDVDYISVHGVTDAPGTDVAINGTGPVIIDNSHYGDFSAYITANASSYIIDVTDSDNTTIYGTFIADLTPYSGQGIVIFSSGFVNPAFNQNGPPYGLFVALPDGSVFPFPNITGIQEHDAAGSFSLQPNPASDFTILQFKSLPSVNSEITLMNLTGQTVQQYELYAGSKQLQIETSHLTRGLYFIRIKNETATWVKKLVVQ
jgi:hypothetical protein